MKTNIQFDYDLQVWIKDNEVQKCGHPESMRTAQSCCNANLLKGLSHERAIEVANAWKLKAVQS